MDDLVALFARSTDRCSTLIESIRPDQWSNPTPCTGWDLRALVNHLTAEQLWAPHLLAGETIEQVGDRYDGDVLGDDPAATWRQAVAGSVAAFAEPGALDRTVHLSYGDESAREYLLQMLTDAAVHGWDVARAIGAGDEIDPEVATLLLRTWQERRELVRASGVFGDEVEVPAGADDQTRLLALLGRRR